METLASGRNHAYFAQYIAPKGDPFSADYVAEKIKIEKIAHDPEWIDKNLPAISAFYDLYISELSNPEHLEPLRVVIDTPEAGELFVVVSVICCGVAGELGFSAVILANHCAQYVGRLLPGRQAKDCAATRTGNSAFSLFVPLGCALFHLSLLVPGAGPGLLLVRPAGRGRRDMGSQKEYRRG